MDFTPGSRLGAYEIVGALGAGGMGVVYRARHTILNREVAIKVLPEQYAQDGPARARFEREAQAVAALSHPNIMGIHDFGYEGNVCYAVTELLRGEPLRDTLKRGPLPWRQAIEIGAAIADGLGAAHAKGIIHRDLKPENVYLTEDGGPKILDFGLARVKVFQAADPDATMLQTEPGMILGTVAYMSPEHVKGEPVDAPGDVFSLGSMLYEMVTGERPFARKTAAETMAAILNDPPPAAMNAPPALDQAIGKCLAKRPESRYGDGREVAAALRELGTMSTASVRAIPEETQSLAVLPLANASADADADYLSDGITETVINNLSQAPKLKVAPRSSVFRFKNRDADPCDLGRELRVQKVLTGRLAQRGDNLRVQVELTDVQEGAQIWGERFNRKIADIFEIEEEIATEIAAALRLRLTGEEKKRITKRYTEDSEAYREYLKGRYFWNQRHAGAIRQALEMFESAIRRDAEFAPAYSGIADCYVTLSWYRYGAPAELMVKALAAAERALAIDPDLAEAWTSLAGVKAMYEWQWDAALAGFEKAVALQPRYATARYWRGMVLGARGEFTRARDEFRAAMELEPLSLVVTANYGWTLLLAGDYEASLGECRRALDLMPKYVPALLIASMALQELGRYEEAIEAGRNAVEWTVENTPLLAPLACGYARAGRREEAAALQRTLREAAAYVSPYDHATIHCCLGETEAALSSLEDALRERASWMIFAAHDPRLAPLRREPRFQDVVRRVMA